jgi:hypothetical protein
MKVLLPQIQTDLAPVVCPSFQDPFEDYSIKMDPRALTNKLVEQVIRTPGREPSPQPTHFSVNSSTLSSHGNGIGGNGHRVMRSATLGYIAPKFAGKDAQKKLGTLYPTPTRRHASALCSAALSMLEESFCTTEPLID